MKRGEIHSESDFWSLTLPGFKVNDVGARRQQLRPPIHTAPHIHWAIIINKSSWLLVANTDQRNRKSAADATDLANSKSFALRVQIVIVFITYTHMENWNLRSAKSAKETGCSHTSTHAHPSTHTLPDSDSSPANCANLTNRCSSYITHFI